MKRELTTAAIAAVGLFLLTFGYFQAFISPVFLYDTLTPDGPEAYGWRSQALLQRWQFVGMLILSIGAGFLVLAFLYYRHRDKQ